MSMSYSSGVGGVGRLAGTPVDETGCSMDQVRLMDIQIHNKVLLKCDFFGTQVAMPASPPKAHCMFT